MSLSSSASRSDRVPEEDRSSAARSGQVGEGRLSARIKSLIRAVPDFPIPGIRFRDVMGLVEDADGFRAATAALADRFRDAAPEVVVGIEARGFIFGVPVAQELGVGFVAVRKAGKLPGEVRSVDYALEYGTATLEIQVVAPIGEGTMVLVIDELLATGGSAGAAIELVRGQGGVVVGAGFVVDLPELPGRWRGWGLRCLRCVSFGGGGVVGDSEPGGPSTGDSDIRFAPPTNRRDCLRRC